jgi:hypothetical protein
VAAGDLDPVDYAAATRETRSRLTGVDARIAAVTGRQATAGLAGGEDVRASWAAAAVDQRRAVLHEHLDRIEIGPGTPGAFSLDTVTPRWRD